MSRVVWLGQGARRGNDPAHGQVTTPVPGGSWVSEEEAGSSLSDKALYGLLEAWPCRHSELQPRETGRGEKPANIGDPVNTSQEEVAGRCIG